MDQYRCHKSYTPKTRVGPISDTVELLPRKSSMQKISSSYDAIHAAQYLIHALKNIAPAISLGTLVNTHKEALRSLAKIFEKATSPARSTRVVQPEQNQPIR